MQFLLVILLSFFGSIVEMLSLGSIIPFIGIIVTPEKIFILPIMAPLINYLGITEPSELILPLAIIFAGLALLAGCFRVLILFCNLQITFLTGAELSNNLFHRTLHQPYSVHLARNSSNLISVISNKVNIATSVLSAWMILLSSLILLSSIVLTIVLVQPVISIFSVFLFGGLYSLISLFAKKKLHINGQLIASAQSGIIRALQEGLGSIRDVLLDSSQKFYEDTYFKSISSLNRAYSSNAFIFQAPRFILESAAMILIALFIIFTATQPGEELADYFAILALFGLAAQRLLPLMQLIFSSWSSIVAGIPAMYDVLELLDQEVPKQNTNQDPEVAIMFEENICLSNAYFSFNSQKPWVIEDFSLKISKGSKIGIMGETGSGKSTLLDLLMGLLIPDSGGLTIDSTHIDAENLKYWQKNVSHVPQSIYLTDTNIRENIAFGLPVNMIDDKKLIHAAKQAQIHDFILTKPDGYDTKVGERGVQLSGGQRQRIGIARALYKNSQLIVFDEATSALDNATENEIMETIWSLSKDLTIIMVAHRLTTLKKCDSIIELKNGSINRIGGYEQIVNLTTEKVMQ